MFVSNLCQRLALKLLARSHSSHFIKLQASEACKCWNRLCQCFFFFFFLPGDIFNMVYEVEVSPGHMRAGHESQALGLHFTNKLSLLQTGGKAAPNFFSFHFQYPTPLMAGSSLHLSSPPGRSSVLAAAAKGSLNCDSIWHGTERFKPALSTSTSLVTAVSFKQHPLKHFCLFTFSLHDASRLHPHLFQSGGRSQ